jgi:hypothetical protein
MTTLTSIIEKAIRDTVGMVKPRTIWNLLRRDMPTLNLKVVQRILHRLAHLYGTIKVTGHGLYYSESKVDSSRGGASFSNSPNNPRRDWFSESRQRGASIPKPKIKPTVPIAHEKPRTSIMLVGSISSMKIEPGSKIMKRGGDRQGRTCIMDPHQIHFTDEITDTHRRILKALYNQMLNKYCYTSMEAIARDVRASKSEKSSGAFNDSVKELIAKGLIHRAPMKEYHEIDDLNLKKIKPSRYIYQLTDAGIRALQDAEKRICTGSASGGDHPPTLNERTPLESMMRNVSQELMWFIRTYSDRAHAYRIRVPLVNRPDDKVFDQYLGIQKIPLRPNNPKYLIRDVYFSYEITRDNLFFHPLDDIWSNSAKEANFLVTNLVLETLGATTRKINNEAREYYRSHPEIKEWKFLELTKEGKKIVAEHFDISQQHHPIVMSGVAQAFYEKHNADELIKDFKTHRASIEASQFRDPVDGMQKQVPELEMKDSRTAADDWEAWKDVEEELGVLETKELVTDALDRKTKPAQTVRLAEKVLPVMTNHMEKVNQELPEMKNKINDQDFDIKEMKNLIMMQYHTSENILIGMKMKDGKKPKGPEKHTDPAPGGYL